MSLCLAAPAFTGCGDITGRGPAPLERTVVAIDNHPRAGHVYCMRGWLGIFSTGMDALAQKIDTQVGVPAVSVADEEWLRLRTWLVEEHDKGAIAEPLVLLGHSYGADDSIRVAKTLKEHGIAVDLLVLIDPVTPPAVPDNVSRVFCVYKSHPLTDWYPAWRGVPATVEKWVRLNHASSKPRRVLEVAGAWCDLHEPQAGGAAVQLCVTETGGHSWPGAASVRRGKEAASQALDANDVIWGFFEQASR